jgi:Methylmalonyl-CoA mutase
VRRLVCNNKLSMPNLKSIYTIDDLSDIASEDLEFQQLAQLKSTEKFYILEAFRGKKNKAISNIDVLDALNDGASSLLFNFDEVENYRKILTGVYADLIQISCNYNGDKPLLFLNNWEKAWNDNNLNYSKWKGNISFNLPTDEIAKLSLQLPKNVRSYCINYSEDVKLDILDRLSAIYSRIVEMLSTASKYDHFGRFQVNWKLTDDQIENIAAIRAIRVLWSKALQKYNINLNESPLWICGFTSLPEDYGNDPSNSLIFTSLQLLSASLGGVDECFNSSIETAQNEFRHYARHQSLVILNESNIFSDKDSTKGSFAIEYLTHYLVKNAIS